MSEIVVKTFSEHMEPGEIDLIGQQLSGMLWHRPELVRQLRGRHLGRLAVALSEEQGAIQRMRQARMESDFYRPKAAVALDASTGYVVGYAEMEQASPHSITMATRALGRLASRQMRIGQAMEMDGPKVTAFTDPRRPDWRDELSEVYSRVRDNPLPYRSDQTPAWTIEAAGWTHGYNEFHDMLLAAGYHSDGHVRSYDFGSPDEPDEHSGRLYTGW